MAYEITKLRVVPADDFSHEHVELVGYESQHTPGEPITVPVSRIAGKIALGEEFVVMVDGEPAAVSVGKCEACGHEPHLISAKDTAERKPLFQLPRL